LAEGFAIDEIVHHSSYEDRSEQHVYVDDKGQFPGKFNKWERKVIEGALSKRVRLSGCLRNPPRKDYSLAVPYLGVARITRSTLIFWCCVGDRRRRSSSICSNRM
jgi:hypothetical protein